MRRRTLAASVVVTVSLTELACTSGSGGQMRNPPPQKLDTKQTPDPEPIGHNPPDPSVGEQPPEQPPPEQPPPEQPPPEQPPPEETLPAAKVASNVTQRPNGSCWEHYDVNCPEGAKCNPPAPQEVQCPPQMELPTAKNPEAVRVRASGECYESLGNVGCPPGVRCNPPPPRRVKCPDKPEAPEEQ